MSSIPQTMTAHPPSGGQDSSSEPAAADIPRASERPVVLGARSATRLRTVPSAAIITCLDGEAAVQLHDRRHTLKTGDRLVVPPHVSYYLEGIEPKSLLVESFSARLSSPGRDDASLPVAPIPSPYSRTLPGPDAFSINYR